MFVPAFGAMVLTKILYLAPSRAIAREKPNMPSFYNHQHMRFGKTAKMLGGLIKMTYCSCVICLPKVTVDPASASCVDDTSILLL